MLTDSWCPLYSFFSHLSYSGNSIDHHLAVTLHHVMPLVQTVALELKKGFNVFNGRRYKIKTDRRGMIMKVRQAP